MTSNLVIAVVVAATLPAFSKKSTSDVRITIRIMDYVNIPAVERAEVQTNAKRILGQAGVAVAFVDCFIAGVATGDETCRNPLGPVDFDLRISPPKQSMKGELGYAAMSPDGGAIVTVFIDPRRRKARAGNLSNGVIVGHAVAHEIGHLLLGPNSHSAAGIMRPVWRPVDEEWMAQGGLLFDQRQASRMRSALIERLSRSNAAPPTKPASAYE